WGGGAAVWDGLATSKGRAALADVAGDKVAAVVHAARLARARALAVEAHLADLRSGLPAGVPVLEVPEMFTRAGGRRVVSLVADALREQVS
ncbi:MAG TPA: hypothetical protein PLV13_07510, partial [Ilumatobacteraceae bacterium]|nr:hypothetical protein [Ilumatobacteraceae bacterium]